MSVSESRPSSIAVKFKAMTGFPGPSLWGEFGSTQLSNHLCLGLSSPTHAHAIFER